MKCFCWLLLVLAACGRVGAQDLPGGVRLNVARSQTNATLSWALPEGNLVLESATSLSSRDWQSVLEMLTITDGRWEVSVPLDQGQRYYRLRSAGAFSRSVGEDVSAPAMPNGYITAVLRSECTSAPRSPPPVGGIAVGPDYVIMTVADGDPLDYPAAQRVVTDAVFESLMPLYCALTEGPRGAGCVTNRVQWNLVGYDAGGNPRLSGSPTSGPGFHYFGACSLTPEERIQNLLVWVKVDVAAGVLDRRDGDRLTARLHAALRRLDHGNSRKAIAHVKRFLQNVDAMVKRERLPAAAAQPLRDGALATVTQLKG